MRYALLFPGQGSQSVGMLKSLSERYPQIEATLTEATDVMGWDLAGLVAHGPEAELKRTERTQPTLLAVEVGVWRAWLSSDPPLPTVLAGHSLGEYAALVCSGALDFADALKLVELRGQLMQEASQGQQAGMAAIIGLDERGVLDLCAAYHGDGLLEPANFNAPGQVVVAADRKALEWLKTDGKSYGARKVMELAMSVPSHCTLMQGVSRQLGERLMDVPLHPARIPVLHNLDAKPRTSEEAIRAALAEQLYHPVRWTQIVESMKNMGISVYLECGPGRVLSGLNRRMMEDGESYPLEEPEQFERARDVIGGQRPLMGLG